MPESTDLYKAFVDNELEKFIELLEIYQIDPNVYIKEKELTVFEIILQTPKSTSFIEKCIEFGGDFYVQNDKQKYPLHYLIESKCVDNLEIVEKCLWDRTTNQNKNLIILSCVNVKNRSCQNSLHLLLEYLNNQNRNEIFKMIKILVSHGCNAKSPDYKGETPLHILEGMMSSLNEGFEIYLFVKYSSINVDNSNIRFFNFLDVQITRNFVYNHNDMLNLLKTGEINKFETKLSFLDLNIHDEIISNNCSFYLEIAIEKSLLNIVDLLIKKGIDLNMISADSEAKVPPLFLAYKLANVGIFKSLLMAKGIDLYWKKESYSRTLLHHFFFEVQLTPKKVELTIDQRKCFDLLINNPKCDVKYLNIVGKFGNSALYFSVGYGIDYMTMKLLEKGAFIGPVITKINKNLFQDFLDSCITSNDKFHDSDEFKISINYKFLIPPSITSEMNLKRRFSVFNNAVFQRFNTLRRLSDDILDHELVNLNMPQVKPHPEKFYNEMSSLKELIDNNDYKQFIMHPVISSFVLLKWKKIGFLLYLNLILTVFFVLTIIPFILNNQTTPKHDFLKCPKHLTLFILSCISLALLIIRELSQFFLAPKRYFKFYSNYIDFTIIISSICILFDLAYNREMLRVLHTLVIFLSTWECFNLLGFLPIVSISLHIKMFRKVFMTFLKSLSIYSVIILGFAICFHMLHGDIFWMDLQIFGNENHTENVIQILTNTSRSDRFNNFYSLGSSIIKSFVMLTGELDASDIYFDGLTYIVVFMLFLLVVTIVLYNLLNALAISDTQEIYSDAKLIDLTERIVLMHKYELDIFSGSSRISTFLQKLISLFPDTILDGLIILNPKDNGNIFKINGENISKGILARFLKYLEMNMTISKSIIQDMHNLLMKKREDHAEDHARHFMKFIHHRMIKMNVEINELKNMQNKRVRH